LSPRQAYIQAGMDNDKSGLERAIALEASGEYRVLRKLPRRREFSAEEADVKLGVILDIETTGLNPRSDEIIELGMLKFAFSSEGRVSKVVDEFQRFREPNIAVPAEVAKLTGITAEMLAGKSIDPEHVSVFLADVVLVIAHEARFDRPFCEAQFPVFATKYWACSNSGVDWRARGHRGTKLTYLLNDFGYFYEGHRALDDCHAVLEVLVSVLPGAAHSSFGELLKNARKASIRIWAEGAPFEFKDALRARGYRWSDGSNGSRRAWWTDVGEDAVDAEVSYLRGTVFGGQTMELPMKRITGLDRFSSRA
jgi:DNA polymerase-3 subunit epsilon